MAGGCVPGGGCCGACRQRRTQERTSKPSALPAPAPPLPPPPQSTLAAQLPPSVLRTQAAFSRYEEGGPSWGVRLEFLGGSHRPVRASLLVGADGAQSAVRQQLLADGPPTYQGERRWRAGGLQQAVQHASWPSCLQPALADLVLAHAGSAIWRGVRPRPAWWPRGAAYCLWAEVPAIVRGFPHPGGDVIWQARLRPKPPPADAGLPLRAPLPPLLPGLETPSSLPRPPARPPARRRSRPGPPSGWTTSGAGGRRTRKTPTRGERRGWGGGAARWPRSPAGPPRCGLRAGGAWVPGRWLLRLLLFSSAAGLRAAELQRQALPQLKQKEARPRRPHTGG